MKKNIQIHKESTALLVIDIQDRLYSHVERSCEVFQSVMKIIKGCKILHLPIFITEQYPEKMGKTLLELREELPEEEYSYFSKTGFSCMKSEEFKKEVLARPETKWILIGIEAHVCVLQTAKDLVAMGKDVVVLNDAITSRSIYDYSTAIAEMRDIGVRVSTVETVLFELVADSKAPEFKAISGLIK